MQWQCTVGCAGQSQVVLVQRPPVRVDARNQLHWEESLREQQRQFISDTSWRERSVEAFLFDENLSNLFSRCKRNKKTQFRYHKDAFSLARGSPLKVFGRWNFMEERAVWRNRFLTLCLTLLLQRHSLHLLHPLTV